MNRMQSTVFLFLIASTSAISANEKSIDTQNASADANRAALAFQDGHAIFSKKLATSKIATTLLQKYLKDNVLQEKFTQTRPSIQRRLSNQTRHFSFEAALMAIFTLTEEPGHIPQANQNTSLAHLQKEASIQGQKFRDVWYAYHNEKQEIELTGRFLKTEGHFDAFKEWAIENLNVKKPNDTIVDKEISGRRNRLATRYVEMEKQWLKTIWWNSGHKDRPAKVVSQPDLRNRPLRQYVYKPMLHSPRDLRDHAVIYVPHGTRTQKSQTNRVDLRHSPHGINTLKSYSNRK
jgi:hypothetical protein